MASFGIAVSASAQVAPTPVPVPADSPASAPASAPASVPTRAPAESLSQPASAPVEAPAQTPKPVEAPKPKPIKALAIGSQGRVELHGLLQGWYDTNIQAEKFGADENAIGTFRIRRAEVSLTGDIVPDRFSFRVMTDFAKGLFKTENQTITTVVTDENGNPVLDENGNLVTETTTITGVKNDNVLPVRDIFVLGQFKIPISYEGVGSSAQLLFPERALSSKGFGDKRDIGIKVEKRLENGLYYNASLFNGAGENQLDVDQAKDLGWRLEYSPILSQDARIVLATAGLVSLASADSAAKDEVEADLRLEYGPALLQTELIGLHTRTATNDAGEQTITNGLGYYVVAAYTYDERLQVAGRFGGVDPNLAVAPGEDRGQIHAAEFALSYFLLQNRGKKVERLSEHPEFHEAKLQASFAHFMPTDTADNVATNEVILALQSWF
jgi:phosphate-selective porin